MIGQCQGVKRKVPAVLARILAPRPVAKRGGAQHGFQPVGLVQEGELRIQPRPVRHL